jgi:hypothetical protein
LDASRTRGSGIYAIVMYWHAALACKMIWATGAMAGDCKIPKWCSKISVGATKKMNSWGTMLIHMLNIKNIKMTVRRAVH